MKTLYLLLLLSMYQVGYSQQKEVISLDSIQKIVYLNITTKSEIIEIFGDSFQTLTKAGDDYKEMYYPEKGIGFDFVLETDIIDAIIVHPQFFKGKDTEKVRFRKGLTVSKAMQLNGKQDYIRYYPENNQLTIFYPFKAFISKQKNIRIKLTEKEKNSAEGILLEGARLKSFLATNKYVKIDYITIISDE